MEQEINITEDGQSVEITKVNTLPIADYVIKLKADKAISQAIIDKINAQLQIVSDSGFDINS